MNLKLYILCFPLFSISGEGIQFLIYFVDMVVVLVSLATKVDNKKARGVRDCMTFEQLNGARLHCHGSFNNQISEAQIGLKRHSARTKGEHEFRAINDRRFVGLVTFF